MNRRHSFRLLFVSLATLALPLHAQTVAPDVGIGIAIPRGALGANRNAGTLLRAGLRFGAPTRITQLRLDLEGAFMPRRSDDAGVSSASGGMRSLSVGASLLIGARHHAFEPYAIFGLALHRLSVDGHPNPYGSTGGARVGVGLQHAFGQYRLALEAGAHLLFTDYGTGRDFSAGTYNPIQIGITF